MVKNLPAKPETWVRSLGWKDPLEEGVATHSSILAWRIPMVRGHKESDMTKHNKQTLSGWCFLCPVAQSCLTLCDPMDCSPPGFSVHGIFQAKVL